jgi:hypothetical protein
MSQYYELTTGLMYELYTVNGAQVASIINSTNNNAYANITVPNSITDTTGTVYSIVKISSTGFQNNTSLISIDLNNTNIVNIEYSSFSGCTSLTSVILPFNINNIPKKCFYNCTSLTTISPFNNISVIGSYAFSNCISLTSAGIGSLNNVQFFYSGCFKNCISLNADLVFNSSNTVIFRGSTFSGSGITSLTLSNNYEFVGNLSTIGGVMFLSDNDRNFYNCPNLQSITISGSPKNRSFGPYEFYSPSVSYINFSTPSTSIFTYYNNSSGTPTFPNTPQLTVYYNCCSIYELNKTMLQMIEDLFTNSVNFVYNFPCFKEGTKILTDKGYIPIEKLRKGDLVKTLLNDYKAIYMVGKREIYHQKTAKRVKNQLYKCTQTKYPEVFEDLILTGCHSILVDNFKNETQWKNTIEVNGNIYITDAKYRLPACADDRTAIYENKGHHTIYHLALENENYYENYGIYANGLLVETCSKRYLKELSNMIFIE